VGIPGGVDGRALEDVHKGQNGACKIDDDQGGPRGISENDLSVFRQAQVEDEDARFGGHESRVVEDGKDIFATAKRRPIGGGNVGVVPAQTVGNTKVDGEREEEANEPGKEYDFVVAADILDDEVARVNAGGYEDGGDDEGRGGDGEDGGPSIWHMARIRCRGHGDMCLGDGARVGYRVERSNRRFESMVVEMEVVVVDSGSVGLWLVMLCDGNNSFVFLWSMEGATEYDRVESRRGGSRMVEVCSLGSGNNGDWRLPMGGAVAVK
jgi:hypothetical protein